MKKNIKVHNGLGDLDLDSLSPYLGIGDETLIYIYIRKVRIRSIRYSSERIGIKKIVVTRSK